MLKNIPRAIERIKASVFVNGNGCWIWQKTRAQNGYGSYALGGGKNIRAHRASYEAFVGPIPKGFDVCHRCDVRECVNPDHLFVGTRSENILDAASKNRVSRTHQKKGAEHPSAKLDEAKVSEILKRVADGEPKSRIARAYGVSDRSVLLIARGETWRHVTRAA